MHSVFTEEDGRRVDENHMEEQRKEERKRAHEAESEHIQTEWVLCSEDCRDIVITYVPQLNTIPIEDNYAEISQEKIKKVYKQYKRRAQRREQNDCIC